MEAFLLVARIILAGVFAVAGVAKPFDRPGSEKAIVNFGLPENLAKPLAILLPLVEIITAILLLLLATAWTGAILATILLFLFVGGIIYNITRGNTADCHCFGQIHSEPIGWSVLIRNLILTAIAGFVIFAGRANAGLSVFIWIFELTAGERMQLVFNLVFVALLIAVVVALRNVLRNQTVLQRQIEILELGANENERREITHNKAQAPTSGMRVGAVAPTFAAVDLQSKQFTLENLLLRGRSILLFFVSPNCAPCKALLPEIEQWQAELGRELTIVLASTGKTKDNRDKFAKTDDGKIVLIQKDNEIATLFGSQWTPSAVLINADGSIGSALATGDIAIRSLMKRVIPALLASNVQAPVSFLLLPENRTELFASMVGKPAPDFILPSLDGREISLTSYLTELNGSGQKTLVLFWRATCPFCRQMADDLKTWETQQRNFNLLILARNETEIELAKEFKPTVLIETDLEVQQSFGVNGTPSGFLIDKAGTIVSDLAIGANEVFALIGYHKNN